MSAFVFDPDRDKNGLKTATDLLRVRDEVFDRLVAYAKTCKSVRKWANEAGVSEALIRKMRQGEIPKLETLATLESALPEDLDRETLVHDLAYAEETLTPSDFDEVGPTAGLVGRALEIWRNTADLDSKAFHQALSEAGIARRMSAVHFDQSGLLKFDFMGEDMGKLRSLCLHRPVRHLVNKRMAEAAETRMLKADLRGEPQMSRISFGLPGEGVIRCIVLNLPFTDEKGEREIVNVSTRY
ncbi:MAG: hypothetical protein NXI16_05620 [Alphaproteobacteria bacterium]|nr:hypothetical protein [Alphaproteobacteria bacterium]